MYAIPLYLDEEYAEQGFQYIYIAQFAIVA